MKYSVDDLLCIVYEHYPRGLACTDARYQKSEKYKRLVAARRRAGTARGPWRALLQRLNEQFPENLVQDGSLHLPTGTMDAGYVGTLYLDTTPEPIALTLPLPDPDEVSSGGSHTIGFMISFVCPYHVVYGSRMMDDIEATQAALSAPPPSTAVVFDGDAAHILPIDVVKPEIKDEALRRDRARRERLWQKPLQRRVITFEPQPDELPYAGAIAREIVTAFGGEPMPPEVGNIIVPDVATNNRNLGEARLYDCLFSENW